MKTPEERWKKNLLILQHAPLPTIFKLRDAARVMEENGVELEPPLNSKTLEVVVRMK